MGAVKVLVLFLCLKSVLSDSVLDVFDSYDDFISGDGSTEVLLSTDPSSSVESTSAEKDSLSTTNPTVVYSPDTTVSSTPIPIFETTTTYTSAPSVSSTTTLASTTEESLLTTSLEPSKQTTIGLTTTEDYSTTNFSSTTDHSDTSERFPSFPSSSSIVLPTT